MNHEGKEQIKKLIAAQIDVAGSQNKYAEKIDISAATLTNLSKGNWDLISDSMWQKMGFACGYSETGWQLAETSNFKKVTQFLHEAKTFHEVYAIVSPAGSSKTQALKAFVSRYSEVYLLECEEHWNKKEFLTRLYRSMGKNPEGLRTGELLDAIELTAAGATNPIIVMDEIDKLRDDLLYFFISLYNRLHGKCGIVMCATEYLQKRIIKGMRTGKKGYEEFFSRVGGKFIEGHRPTGTDITLICKANGLEDASLIEEVIKDCMADLRRVERLVNAKKRKANKNNNNPNEGRAAA